MGSELADAEGSQKAVGPLKDDKFLLLIRRKEGRVSAIDANCGKCRKAGRKEGKINPNPNGSRQLISARYMNLSEV